MAFLVKKFFWRFGRKKAQNGSKIRFIKFYPKVMHIIFLISSIELQEQEDGIDWFFLFIYFFWGGGYFEFLAPNAPKIKFFKFYENCVVSTIFMGELVVCLV